MKNSTTLKVGFMSLAVLAFSGIANAGMTYKEIRSSVRTSRHGYPISNSKLVNRVDEGTVVSIDNSKPGKDCLYLVVKFTNKSAPETRCVLIAKKNTRDLFVEYLNQDRPTSIVKETLSSSNAYGRTDRVEATFVNGKNISDLKKILKKDSRNKKAEAKRQAELVDGEYKGVASKMRQALDKIRGMGVYSGESELAANTENTRLLSSGTDSESWTPEKESKSSSAR